MELLAAPEGVTSTFLCLILTLLKRLYVRCDCKVSPDSLLTNIRGVSPVPTALSPPPSPHPRAYGAVDAERQPVKSGTLPPNVTISATSREVS